MLLYKPFNEKVAEKFSQEFFWVIEIFLSYLIDLSLPLLF